jgi:hypothetical protein
MGTIKTEKHTQYKIEKRKNIKRKMDHSFFLFPRHYEIKQIVIPKHLNNSAYIIIITNNSIK